MRCGVTRSIRKLLLELLFLMPWMPLTNSHLFSQNPLDTDLGVVKYDIRLTPDFNLNRVDVIVGVIVRNVSNRPLSAVQLSLGTPDVLEEMSFVMKEILYVNGADRKSAPFSRKSLKNGWGGRRDWSVYEIPFESPLAADAEISLECAYRLEGTPLKDALPIPTNKDRVKELYLIRDFEWLPSVFFSPLPGMFPNVARPEWRLRVQYPSTNRGIVDGKLQRRTTDQGMVVEEWNSSLGGLPQILIGPYQVFSVSRGGFIVEMYLPPQRAEASKFGGDILKSLGFLTKLYGAPPDSVYRLVATFTPYGGHALYMGQALEQSYLESASLNTMVHELAHTWWGFIVSSYGPGSKFLRESFAEYSSALAMSSIKGAEAMRAAHIEWKIKSFCGYPAKKDLSGNRAPVIEQEGFDYNETRGAAYNKGPLVLSEIRNELGDAPFFESLAAFLREHRDRNVTMTDFVTSMSKAAKRDLQPLLHALCSTPGYPSYRVEEFRCGKRNDRFVTSVMISNRGEVVSHCSIGLKTADSLDRRLIKVDGKGRRTFEFTTSGEVLGVEIDPDLTSYHYDPDQRVPLWGSYDERTFGGQNWLWFGKAYTYHLGGESRKAIETLNKHIDRYMANKKITTLESLGRDPLEGCYLLWRSAFHMALNESERAEEDARFGIPGVISILADKRLHGAIISTGLVAGADPDAELTRFLRLLTGKEFTMDPLIDSAGRRKKVEEWLRWWNAEGKSTRINLNAMRTL